MFDQEFWNLVEKEIEAGYISVQKHPTENLWIYNYTQSAMFDARWNVATMNCRGLIVDQYKNLIARPFGKFFSKEQCESFGIKIPSNESFEVFDKMDGSLGILHWITKKDENGNIIPTPHIATRGSFTSEQAIEATKIFREKYAYVPCESNWTYLFEIIYPENRIVVDYGKTRDLILIAVIETKTGDEIILDRLPYKEHFNIVTKYHGLKDFNKILSAFENKRGTDFEGLVVRFESGFRVKIKTEDYKRLHKILTGINEKRIWECLSSGQGLQEILDVVDDAFYDWVKKVEHDLMISYNATEGVAKLMYKSALEYADSETELNDISAFKTHRKNFAQYVLKCEVPVLRSVCFQMYSEMDYKNIIWEHLKPKGDNRFKIVEAE